MKLIVAIFLWILSVLGIGLLGLILVFIICACILAGRADEYEYKLKGEIKDERKKNR